MEQEVAQEIADMAALSQRIVSDPAKLKLLAQRIRKVRHTSAGAPRTQERAPP